ncbi:Small nuclear ribonucleoprotein Sm D3 [Hondaea fermentalgiana]|uniref:Small nuclear ribonucleoprotein Sm D3 n=1 Tax=Hondaea fermentalgiana TaxID=2315210 RepID=A0A2R5GRQ4_9STRA|nr:Small nuclear ribonucleoprotein Sm D3 [Hondaea fermentalgiana]|eukprot:GBG32989.1 Small nuclear ribonucleoprotein Sm D3 [Hondaea fermentalgiana]
MSADEKLSVPIRLLLEGIGHPVTVEMKNGESYRGQLVEAETTMNLQLSGATHTARNGQRRKLEHAYLRGTSVKFIVLPDFLREATIFKSVGTMKAKHDRDQAIKEKRKQQSRPKNRS